jgi:hypothetical protein
MALSKKMFWRYLVAISVLAVILSLGALCWYAATQYPVFSTYEHVIAPTLQDFPQEPFEIDLPASSTAIEATRTTSRNMLGRTLSQTVDVECAIRQADFLAWSAQHGWDLSERFPDGVDVHFPLDIAGKQRKSIRVRNHYAFFSIKRGATTSLVIIYDKDSNKMYYKRAIHPPLHEN